MKQNRIESLLERSIGLDSEAMGGDVVQKAVRRQMDRCGFKDPNDYVASLKKSGQEWRNLIESIVVPETWFFRNRKVFDYLVRFAIYDWLPDHCEKTLRILSVPCSTGEEPFSIAMALLDAGLDQSRFHIDGVDISEEAVSKARRGFYGRASFRGTDLRFLDRYFEHRGENEIEIASGVKETVRFKTGNVMEKRFRPGGPYDIIFCRNLLIYMTPEARNRTFGAMSRLLVAEGLLFCGHAERRAAIEWGFDAVTESGVFACRKRCGESQKSSKRNGPEIPSHRLKTQAAKPVSGLRPKILKTPPVQPVHGEAASAKENAPEVVNAANLFEKAREMADRGQLIRALELCEMFLADHPIHPEGHFLLGLIHEALSDREKAERSFNHAIYLNPDHFEALNHLAFIESGRGNLRDAQLLRQRARKSAELGVPNAKS